MALRDIGEGDLMVAVPRRLMITAESIKTSKLGKFVCIVLLYSSRKA